MSETNVVQSAPNRTKIVATVGPGSRSPAILRKLIEAGVDVFRLNFSHGTHEEHAAVLADIRTLSRDLGQHVAILQDLCGPKIRLGPIPGDVVRCLLGEEFMLVTERTSNSPRELTCSYRDLPNDLKLGETILFADGTVAMIVTNTEPERAQLKVTLAGQLRSRQGLNLPGSELAVASLTDKDLNDLDWTSRHADDVDFVGLSFVRTPGSKNPFSLCNLCVSCVSVVKHSFVNNHGGTEDTEVAQRNQPETRSPRGGLQLCTS